MKNDKKRPDCWKPDNFLLAEDEDLIFETFTNYPTMLIPKKDYFLDLYSCIEDNSFYELLSNVPSGYFNGKFLNENFTRRHSKSAIDADLTYFSCSTGNISPALYDDVVEAENILEKTAPPPEFSCDIRAPLTRLNDQTLESEDHPPRSRTNSENCLEVAAITRRMEAAPEVIISSPQPVRPPRQKNKKKNQEETVERHETVIKERNETKVESKLSAEGKTIKVPARRRKSFNSNSIPKETDAEEAESNKPSMSGKSCLNVPGISPIINRSETASPAESVHSFQSEKSVSDVNIEMLELKSRRSSIDTRVLDQDNPTVLQQMIMLRQAGQLFLPDSGLISS